MDIRAYLHRIEYDGLTSPTLETLRALHYAHLLTVPFENLDIPERPIVLDEERFFDKIVRQRRGGFCYELNGLFATLLRELGFEVTLLSARVAKDKGATSALLEFDHLALRVDLDEPLLADVGFGDSFLEPLRLQAGLEQEQSGGVYRLVVDGDIWRSERKAEDGWKKEYLFTLRPRQLSEFAEMCRYHQTSPDSPFTRKKVCSRATPDGRITLSDRKLIETRNGVRDERELSDEEWRSSLRELFGIVLPKAESTSAPVGVRP